MDRSTLRRGALRLDSKLLVAKKYPLLSHHAQRLAIAFMVERRCPGMGIAVAVWRVDTAVSSHMNSTACRSAGLTCARYIAYLILAIMAFRGIGSPARKDKVPDRAYLYRGVDAAELQTDRDVTELSIANAEVSQRPSYRSHSVDLPPTSGKELV